MAEKIQFSDIDINFARLDEDDRHALASFYCGVPELDEFIHNEIFVCAKYRALSPYKCFNNYTGEILGLFTLANDTINLSIEDKNSFEFPDGEYTDIFMNQISLPAINIGHLAVSVNHQSKGLGRLIVLFVTDTVTKMHVAGCQFITVDALNNSDAIRFYYDRVGFEFQTMSDYNKPTRRMYLPIIDFGS